MLTHFSRIILFELTQFQHDHFLHRTFWAHTTQKLADHLQEIKAHYCIIQQNTLNQLSKVNK